MQLDNESSTLVADLSTTVSIQGSQTIDNIDIGVVKAQSRSIQG